MGSRSYLTSGMLLLLLLAKGAIAAPPALLDPMRPIEYSPVVAVKEKLHLQELELTGVLISRAREVAIINGDSLQRGDTIAGYRLEKIEADKVLLKNRQGKLVLRRAGTGLKKISPQKGIEKGSKP